jgi:ketosteroid isomerase-like protein
VVDEDCIAGAEHPNVTLVKALMAAFARQDRHAIESLIDPCCVWRVPGVNSLAGEYVGLPAVFRLFGLLKRIMSCPASFDILDMEAQGDRVVSVQYGVVGVAGLTFRIKERLTYRLRDGRVVEADEYQFNQEEFDRIFARTDGPIATLAETT